MPNKATQRSKAGLKQGFHEDVKEPADKLNILGDLRLRASHVLPN